MKRLFTSTPIFIFCLLIVIKSALAWAVIFEDGFSLALLLRELPFALIVFGLIDFFAKKRKFLYYFIANLCMTSILFAVIMYYKYYGVIVNYFALAQVNQVTAVKNSVFSLLDPYFLFIYTDVVIMLWMLIRKKSAPSFKLTFKKQTNRKWIAGLLGVSVALCLFNILPNRASLNDIVKAEQMGIMNYEAYMIMASTQKEAEEEPVEITQQKIDKIKQTKNINEPYLYQTASGKNVIILQMESMQNFLINLKVDGIEITPNLNKLLNESYYFNNFYQQVGQGNTSDAEYVVNTSLYIPQRGAATQMYVDRELPSLPKLLKKANYTSATFHTNVVEFWNRGELYSSLGFDHYYDAEYFGDEDTVFFGASDDMLYKKSMDKLIEMDQADTPFYAQVISMTSHHPFTIPDEKKLITLPEAFDNTLVGNYLVAQNYADHALGQFIDELKQSGIWDDSLIVMYGDHLGLPMYSLDKNELALMDELVGSDYTYTQMINIPLFIINKGVTDGGKVFEQVGGQVDILPTIANLVGLSLDDQIHFGQDIFNQTENILPQRYYLPTGSYLSDDELFLSGSGFEDGKHYPLNNNPSASDFADEQEFKRALELLNLSDRYVQTLPFKESALKDTK